MTVPELLAHRLRNQRLTRTALRTPAEVVSWLGAVQAQDFATAKWGLALRAAGLTDAAVERAFDAGAILRTHAMRPTWHFVAPGDIRWLQELTAARVHQVSASIYRKMELDAATLGRSRRVLERSLRDRSYKTRPELAALLAAAGIAAAGIRLAYLIMHAELERLICSGPRQGRQFTYALVEERAPAARTIDRDEALAELVGRFFASHGPATVRDFTWWSGLTVRDAKAGIDLASPALESVAIDGLTYWHVPSRTAPPPAAPTAHLLPNYDEYLIAHKDRVATAGPRQSTRPAPEIDEWANFLVVDGRFAGTWRRTVEADGVVVRVAPLNRLTRIGLRSVEAAADAFGHFLEKPVDLHV